MVYKNNFYLKSPAKINFFLKVINKLPSGYHEIESFVCLVNIFDNIVIKLSKTKTNVYFAGKFSKLISNEHNSIIKVISLLKKKFYHLDNINFKIFVQKNIPVGSGLGGGTSNAVTVLHFLIKKFNLRISKSELNKIYLSIGADSKIFMNKKPKYIFGYGNKFKESKAKIKINVLLIYPNKPNFTKDVYKLNKVFSKREGLLRINEIIKKNIYDLFKFTNNDLLASARKLNSNMNNLINFLAKQKLCDYIIMSGSGSCCCVVSKSKKNLLKCQKLVKNKYRSYWTAMTKTIT